MLRFCRCISLSCIHSEAEDVLETCHNSLDDLWKLDDWAYPQHRMVHLMDIIAHATTRFIQSKMSGMDLWRSNYNQGGNSAETSFF